MNYLPDQIAEINNLKNDISQLKADIVTMALAGRIDGLAELAKTVLIAERVSKLLPQPGRCGPVQREQMKIIRHYIVNPTLAEFANKHDLTLVIRERPDPQRPDLRFYASFDLVSVKESGCIGSVHGNGATEEDAIRDYTKEISNRLLIRNAWGNNAKEFFCPTLSLE